MNESSERKVDVVVVGAGFAGLYALHALRNKGYSVQVFEAGAGIGGTWYWNRYPGARCDIESIEYSYSFSEDLQQEWNWSARYAEQPEILAYMNHVADKFDLRKNIQLETRVVGAQFDDVSCRWRITTNQGDKLNCQFVIMATGSLSTPKKLDIQGIENFKSDQLHTAYWPEKGYDFSGKRVGIIGTGSTAIQAIPIIAKQAKHLTVFQRTPNFSIPAWNHQLNDEERKHLKKDYKQLRQKEWESHIGIVRLTPRTESALEVSEEERLKEFEARWNFGGISFYSSFPDLLVNETSNALVAEFVRNKIRQKINDPKVAEMLIPKGYPFGAKRLCADTNYYETYNLPNVKLVDVNTTPFVKFTPLGLQTTTEFHELDVLITATGFDALTGTLNNIEITGRNGEVLKDKWKDGPRTYLGIMMAGFPNMFVTTGPGSPSVLFNMVLGNEYHVNWIARAIDDVRAKGAQTIEAKIESEDEWSTHVTEVGNQTLFPKANSWYVGANVPGKPRVILLYLGGFQGYSQRCELEAANGYKGCVVA